MSYINTIFLILSHVGLTVDSVTSEPDGYGIAGQSVVLRCNFQSTQLPIGITWTFTYANGDTSVVMQTVVLEPEMGFGTLSIQNFQAENSGNYSCSISVLDGDNRLGGITSVEKTVRLAGNFGRLTVLHMNM